MRSSIEGQVVAIDAGLAEGTAEQRIASALADELAALGAKPVVLETSGGAGSSGLARAANELSASACISLQVASGEAHDGATVCAYFGSATTHSPAGKRLAELVTEELERRAPLPRAARGAHARHPSRDADARGADPAVRDGAGRRSATSHTRWPWRSAGSSPADPRPARLAALAAAGQEREHQTQQRAGDQRMDRALLLGGSGPFL